MYFRPAYQFSLSKEIADAVSEMLFDLDVMMQHIYLMYSIMAKKEN